jgi:O-acetyl-ADP-ribose deacetylase (regulator of RNase III)
LRASPQRLGTLPLLAGRSFEVVLGDLLVEDVDCIVNAANGHLAHGGGVAAAIARAAGPALEAEGRRIIGERGPLSTGEGVATTAGKLPFKAVIHVVGPRQGQGNEEAMVTRALASAFDIAEARSWRSIAFPAVSSGIFGVPAETCFSAYLAAVREFCARHAGSTLALFRLVLVEGPVADVARRRFAKRD